MMDRLKNIDNAINIMLSEMETGWTNPDTLPLKQRLMRSLINVRQPDKPSQELIDAQDKELAAQREEKGVVELRRGRDTSMARRYNQTKGRCYCECG